MNTLVNLDLAEGSILQHKIGGTGTFTGEIDFVQLGINEADSIKSSSILIYHNLIHRFYTLMIELDIRGSK